MPGAKKSCRALYQVTLAAALALSAALPAGAYAQADGTDGAAAADGVDATTAGIPTLQCSVIALGVMAPEVGGARFVCHVEGAQPGDTSFTARATRDAADPQVAAAQLGPACTGSLVDGIGDCSGGFIDRTSGPTGQFSIIGTLDPSGGELGPVLLAPASVTPPAQPKPLLGTAPTAPTNYFPLPEP